MLYGKFANLPRGVNEFMPHDGDIAGVCNIKARFWPI